jgi:hypothetical protein
MSKQSGVKLARSSKKSGSAGRGKDWQGRMSRREEGRVKKEDVFV